MKAATKKATKEITVLARYAHKNRETGELTGVVTYLVRSADGKSQYCTTLINGKPSACSCDGNEKYHRTCKHMKAVDQKESGRPFASKSLPVWTMWLIESGVLTVPSKTVVETVAQTVVSSVVEQEQSWAELIELEDKMSIVSKRESVLNGAQQSAGLLMSLPSRKAKAS